MPVSSRHSHSGQAYSLAHDADDGAGFGVEGNSAVISSSRTRVLVDAGLSCRELLRRMVIAGEDPAELSAILITHEHQDHVAGLAVLARKLKIPVFFTEQTHRAWVRMLTPRTPSQGRMSYAKGGSTSLLKTSKNSSRKRKTEQPRSRLRQRTSWRDLLSTRTACAQTIQTLGRAAG